MAAHGQMSHVSLSGLMRSCLIRVVELEFGQQRLIATAVPSVPGVVRVGALASDLGAVPGSAHVTEGEVEVTAPEDEAAGHIHAVVAARARRLELIAIGEREQERVLLRLFPS